MPTELRDTPPRYIWRGLHCTAKLAINWIDGLLRCNPSREMRRELEAERALRRENAPKGSRGFGVDYLFIEDILEEAKTTPYKANCYSFSTLTSEPSASAAPEASPSPSSSPERSSP